ncbi:uncharacterized protein LOC121868006 [Homarus americanus]|uniref:uncharacterized protein LOC121868006 n=1 Tax=Homarus americanus TaxID=6706 RepID=UPI001C493963|nr:uncharacterized protein LOC121868006 [Homarus americanus]
MASYSKAVKQSKRYCSFTIPSLLVAILTASAVLVTKMTFFAHVKIDSRFFKMLMVPLAGFLVGTYFDRMETERQSMFRDKSALYGRELAEGEKPSWP